MNAQAGTKHHYSHSVSNTVFTRSASSIFHHVQYTNVADVSGKNVELAKKRLEILYLNL